MCTGETDKTNKGQKQASDNKKAAKETHGKANTKGGKEDKGKGKASKEEEMLHDDDEEAIPPPPLAIKVCIRLQHWNSAKEATIACS